MSDVFQVSMTKLFFMIHIIVQFTAFLLLLLRFCRFAAKRVKNLPIINILSAIAK